jgi:hypothetical protein
VLNYAGAAVGNPLDIGTPLTPIPVFASAMREAARDGGTDILVFDLALNFAHGLLGDEGLEAAGDALLEVRRETGKAMVLVLYSRAIGREDLALERALRGLRERLLAGGIPVYPSMRRAMRALRLVNA